MLTVWVRSRGVDDRSIGPSSHGDICSSAGRTDRHCGASGWPLAKGEGDSYETPTYARLPAPVQNRWDGGWRLDATPRCNSGARCADCGGQYGDVTEKAMAMAMERIPTVAA
jgi:hypothetical protein